MFTIKNKVEELGCSIGCYDNTIEKLDAANLHKVLYHIDEEYTDVDVKINDKDFVVEIATVGSEKDLQVLSKMEYINRYGYSRYQDNY